jgi:hypothetical protein
MDFSEAQPPVQSEDLTLTHKDAENKQMNP